MKRDEFKLFADVGTSFRACATIRRNGQVGFSSGAVKKFSLEGYEWAQIFYAPDKRAIGLAFHVERPTRGALKLTKRPGNFAVAARSLLDLYDIEYRAGKYKAIELQRVDDTDNMYFFVLPET